MSALPPLEKFLRTPMSLMLQTYKSRLQLLINFETKGLTDYFLFAAKILVFTLQTPNTCSFHYVANLILDF